MSKKRVLWFIRGAATQEQIQLAKDNGFLIRNAAIDTSSGFIEQCDAVCGDVPKAYEEVEKVDEPKASKKPAKTTEPDAPPVPPDENAPFDIEKLSKDELKTNLTARGIEFKANASVKALQALLTDAMEKEAEQNGSDNP